MRPVRRASSSNRFSIDSAKRIAGGIGFSQLSITEPCLLALCEHIQEFAASNLVFPGENHPLDKNPWHGYIKVREELKWLDKYGAK